MFHVTSPARVTDTFDRLFDEFFGAWRPTRAGMPALNWITEPDQYVFEAAVPGVAKEDLSIEAVRGRLTIAGERKSAAERTEARQFTAGRFQGKFSRTVTLPEDADVNQVSAELENGILTVRIAKQAEARPRRIEIQ